MLNEELKAAVAMGPMGWTQQSRSIENMQQPGRYTKTCWVSDADLAFYITIDNWNPATDARDTERVVQRMIAAGWLLTLTYGDKTWDACWELDNPDCQDARHSTVHTVLDDDWKRAVCLAAVAAVEATK